MPPERGRRLGLSLPPCSVPDSDATCIKHRGSMHKNFDLQLEPRLHAACRRPPALAAPPAINAVPRRAASRKGHGDGRSPCHFRLAQLAAASLAAIPSGTASERPREAMALSLAENRGRC
eukprot:6640596-Prymnesium_polylepis.2